MLKEFKPILFFIAKFFAVYVLFTLLYTWYLDPYLNIYKIADPITEWIAGASVRVANVCGFSAESVQVEGEVWRRFILDGQYSSMVNEGCNAVSIMIIFMSFIVAFSDKFIKPFVFILVGLLVLIGTNIIRIFLLTWIYRYYPEYSKMGHDYLFPAIIYGIVVILWLVWVKFFAFKDK